MKAVTTISLSIEIMKKLDELSEEQRRSRSSIIEEALIKTYDLEEKTTRKSLF
jgi:predicted transcriptional regulator